MMTKTSEMMSADFGDDEDVSETMMRGDGDDEDGGVSGARLFIPRRRSDISHWPTHGSSEVRARYVVMSTDSLERSKRHVVSESETESRTIN